MIHALHIRKYGMEKSYAEKEQNLKVNGTRDHGTEEEKRGLGEAVAVVPSSYSQGEIKSGLEFCSVLRPTKEQLSFFTPTKSQGTATTN